MIGNLEVKLKTEMGFAEGSLAFFLKISLCGFLRALNCLCGPRVGGREATEFAYSLIFNPFLHLVKRSWSEHLHILFLIQPHDT